MDTKRIKLLVPDFTAKEVLTLISENNSITF
jgi:hypothetical protein